MTHNESAELVLFEGASWQHLDHYIRPDSTVDEVSRVVQKTLTAAGKTPRFRAVRTVPPFPPQKFAPVWDTWLEMREMKPPDNIVPAGIARLSLGLRDLDHPEWSPDTHSRVAMAFLRGAVYERGYTLIPNGDFGGLVLMFEPTDFMLTGHYDGVRDTLIKCMEVRPNGR
ncbi:hypothetical protein [Nocardia salmonicida]|uniref:hypothetical protein n=1 Tax=Nocardia salmonicida TaxID=53431 RepID=UPI002E2B430D|nr:hypothetical protein [Nocardia salmonicida]